MDNIYHQDSVRPTIMELDPMTQFIRSIYNIGLILVGVTVATWLLLLLTNVHLHEYLPFPAYVLAIICFLVMICMHCIPSISYCCTCKWFMVAVVVVCTTLFGCYLIDKLSTLVVSFVMIGVALIIVILNFSGAMCPQEFLPGGVCSTLLMMILLLAMVIVGIIQLCTGKVELLDAFVSILFVMVIIAIPIQAQFNHGRLNIVEVVPEEHLMVCTLTLYLHSMMFFCCVCYFILVEERKEAIRRTTEGPAISLENDFD
ncbi:uncharacterized protein LOC6542579 [Drosophila erecta]|uniref:Uncharacterized protein n=1 Tax=Drosophila erecta TaxID=7220 RepID=B3N7E9_DROER|nr:uncharacterized protein LOC6542579 [Drosophila erecta]EDV58300.1 uncharacterized protein Dere_GG25307 [Drosophila erecta]